jgi:hypothetical protein
MYVLFREKSDIKLKIISTDHPDVIHLAVTVRNYKPQDVATSDLVLHYQRETEKLYLLDSKYNRVERWNEKSFGKKT